LRGAAPRTFPSTWPSGGPGAGRRCRPSRSASGGPSGRPSAATRTSAGGPTTGCFRAGDAGAVDGAYRLSARLLPDALYVHRTALAALDPLRRAYEGCARIHLGEIEGADLITLHRQAKNGDIAPS
jgi:hypothetical protein